MKKILLVLLTACLFLTMTALVSCKEDTPAEGNTQTLEERKAAEITKIAVLKGPTGMGMAKMIKDADSKYEFTVSSAPADVQAELIAKKYDIAALPTNVASAVYNKTQGAIKVLALNTEGVLYILDSTGTVNSIEDLRGKTIGATGQASTPEYVLRYILSENGIDPDRDVTLEFYTEHAELATLMASGQVEIGMLPEPNVTTTMAQNSNIVKAINLTEEWEKISPDSALVQGCIVARTEFIEKYPDSVKDFLNEYKASVDYITTAEDAPEIIAGVGIVPKAEVAKKALPSCNICFYDSSLGMKDKLSGFLEVLHSFDPKAVGAKLPDNAFYYENK